MERTRTTAVFLLLAVAVLTVEGGSISKRQVGFVGGFSPAKVDDPDVLKMADFATTAVSASSNSGPLKLIKIVKAETQVVAGTNYKLNLELANTNAGANAAPIPCEVVIFDQPWTNTRKMIRSSCSPKRKTTRQIPGGSSPLTGGFSPLDVNSANVKEIASFATTAISANTNAGPATLAKVIKAESQVVAGTNFKLTIEVDPVDGDNLLCEVIVFDQPWTNTRKLSESKCFPAKNLLVKVAEAPHSDTQVKTAKK
ncbi:hypothetical protein GHT06_017921 [Daphnia sinensis]|uniref:Cystatin domain-containing protein n=1 Tax=Daphnia sinensis TaxID=1820382 RepID=A0AAD5PPP9_9CRUS|nr:hypothetical protein GHT06_017921 [Daphnia sinensis]